MSWNRLLTCVVLFRFYYLSISKGFGYVLRRRKTELLVYVLLMTHEYLWYIAEHSTASVGNSCKAFTALSHRLVYRSQCIQQEIIVKSKLRQVAQGSHHHD